MRILGIDYGSKILGIAVSDETALIGQALGTIQRTDLQQDLKALRQKSEEYNISKIVVGLPINMDGSLGKAAHQVLDFISEVKKKVDIQVETWDERLSTVEAERVLLDADLSRKKRKKVIDKVAASIILQGYLDHMNAHQAS